MESLTGFGVIEMSYMHKIIRLFKDTHMARQQASLSEIAKTKKIDVRKLKFGEHVAFVNSKWSKGKLYSANNVLSYIVPFDGERFTDNCFEQLIHSFDENGVIDMKKNDRLSVMAKVKKHKPELLQYSKDKVLKKKVTLKSLPQVKKTTISPLDAHRMQNGKAETFRETKNASQNIDRVKKIT